MIILSSLALLSPPFGPDDDAEPTTDDRDIPTAVICVFGIEDSWPDPAFAEIEDDGPDPAYTEIEDD